MKVVVGEIAKKSRVTNEVVLEVEVVAKKGRMTIKRSNLVVVCGAPCQLEAWPSSSTKESGKARERRSVRR